MSYTVGQQAQLFTVVKDVNDIPIDATISLVVTKPDGSTITPSITHPGTGTYTSAFTVNAAGPWLYVWTASGAATGVDDGQIEVAAQGLRIVGLADVKLHLNKKDSDDDVELQDFIDAAQAMIEREIGPVTPKTYSEYYDGGCHRITLYHGPISSITSITENLNGQFLRTLTTNEYTIDAVVGSIARILPGGTHYFFQGGREDVVVQYIGGRTYPVDGNIRLAAKELTAHLWRNSQIGRTSRRGGRSAVSDDDSAPVSLAFSMPNRVRELLGTGRPIVL